jgi:hypothetical protein
MDSFRVFMQRWTTPSVLISLLLLILGGITWGVQLNSAILKLTAVTTQTRASVSELRREGLDAAIIQARTAAVVESIAKQVDTLEARMTRNESWISNNTNHKHGAGE